MNASHELTAHVANMDAQSLSLPFWNLFQSNMNEVPFEVCTFFKYAWRRPNWDTPHLINVRIKTKACIIKKRFKNMSGVQYFGALGRLGKHCPQSHCGPASSTDPQSRQDRPLSLANAMAEGNLCMKFWLNKSIKFQPNTTQNEKRPWQKQLIQSL